jgi:hypothetical protein
MAKSGECVDGEPDAPMADHLFLDIPNSVALAIVELQMQLAMTDITQLPSMPANQWKNRVTDEV